MIFRKTDVYKQKLLRIKAALHKFAEVAISENPGSLSSEAASLEELSLSTFSLMKAIRKEIEAAAKSQAIGAKQCSLLMPTEPGPDPERKIIVPPSFYPFDYEEDSGGS